ETPQKATEYFPSAADLEYPEIKPKDEKSEKKGAQDSKLISLDNFNDYPSEIELEGNYSPEETSDVDELEALIKDEVEEDLWKADEFEDLKSEVEESIDALVENQTEKLFETDED